MILAAANASIPAYSNFSMPKSEPKAMLAPGDAYVPSKPDAASLTASGTMLGLIAGVGLAAGSQALFGNFGGTALTVGLAVATAAAGGFAGYQASKHLI